MKATENKPLFVTGKVLENRNIISNYFEIIIEAPDIAWNARPGQFVMLSRWSINNLFLKRPFSFVILMLKREDLLSTIKDWEGC